ncbi:uncharacterized protein B0I36DRAFT_311764 [Microdochium trichocladiopsis]|uniref:Protein-S-isoprenylcysteine O-methyltransferase n=1 Tax=Microdochium trichocladiopsis TaxID=1682393 RepID=A0A9P8YIJ3_9PEZI|nr:uncharacterized protein B0I36DRAFT_311764 [Microdochium trichocladiopsis]KAH7040925.1 hypothetical protein B0I36DRAFT_311764 [Microdochium trichocladiopsis]
MSALIPPPTSVSQAALAATMLLAAWLTFVGVTPPHVPPSDDDNDGDNDDDNEKTAKHSTSSSAAGSGSSAKTAVKAQQQKQKQQQQAPPDDTIRAIQLTTRRGPSIVFSHIAFLASYAAFLAYNYDPATNTLPGISGATTAWAAPYCHLNNDNNGNNGNNSSSGNSLQPALLTWSPHTILPLLSIILIGAPLRLIPYSTLAKNFTFALTEPDKLVTSGIYSLVQHPSYTGLAALFFGNSVLYYRYDTPLAACWCPPEWYPWIKMLAVGFVWPTFVAAGFFGISVRVRQEERMLKAKFGKEWEQWNSRTARFIPYLF